MTLRLPTPDGPDSTVSRAMARAGSAGGPVVEVTVAGAVRTVAGPSGAVGGELALERPALVVAEAADPPAGRDAEPLHDPLGAHLADAGHRLEQRRHLH